MKAVLLTGHGGLEKLVYREDVPDPVPGPADVLVRVGAAGVNNTDLWTREGAYGVQDDPTKVSGWRREPLSFPVIQGADVVGTIVAVGEGVSADRIGERVIVDSALYTTNGDGLLDAGILGSERDGGFAELVALPAANAHAIDSPLSDAELASFPTAYVTAERMLRRARVDEGDTLLVTGASGGVGTGLVQLAKRRGAWVVAVVGPSKEDSIRAIGADAVIARGAPMTAAVERELGGRPLNVVADVVGGDTVGELLNLLCPGGRYVVAGAIAGAMATVDLRTIYLKQLDLLGSTMGDRSDFARLLEAIESGVLKPLVAATYPLSELRRAQEDFISKRFVGKLVVIPQRIA
jgi:NADPH:quinone reductase-like Zn-dependent oxidoreductase